MTEPSAKSIVAGEHLGMPDSPKTPFHDLGQVRIGQHEVPITDGMVRGAEAVIDAAIHNRGHHPLLHACKAAFDQWKAHQEESTPVTHSDADKHPPAPTHEGSKPAPARTGRGCFG